MRIFGVCLIVFGTAGVVLTSLLSLVGVGLLIAATGVAVSGAIFYAAGEMVAEMRLLAKWLNDEQQRRMEETGIAKYEQTKFAPIPRQ